MWRQKLITFWNQLPAEVHRKAFHQLAIVYLIGYAILPRWMFVGSISIALIVVASVEFLRLRRPELNAYLLERFKGIYREKEALKPTGIFWMLLGCWTMLIVTTNSAFIYASLGYLIFGDTAAALGGKKWGRRPWKHNPQRTQEGSLCFFLVSAIWGIFFLKWYVAVLSALIVAGIESLDLKWDDNFLLPPVAAFVMVILNYPMNLLFLGAVVALAWGTHQLVKRWGKHVVPKSLALLVIFGQLAHPYEPGKFYFQGKTTEKKIALTFDDGPGPWTIEILNFLKEKNIKATFFMEGSQVKRFPQIAKRVVDEGHEIGNHTYQHHNYKAIKDHPAEDLSRELDLTEKELEKVAGVRTKIVRMPHGYFNRSWLLPLLKEKGYALVHWSFGSDWLLKQTSEEMAQGYIANAKPGAVFLLHDGGNGRKKTLLALQTIVTTLQGRGYQFVRANELFS